MSSASEQFLSGGKLPAAPLVEGNASEAFLARRADDPDPLLADLKNMLRQHAHSHPRHLQIQLGPSEVGHPCSRKLAQGLLGMPQVNPQYDPLPSYVGVAAHKAMEDAAALDNKILMEQIVAAHGIDALARAQWPRWLPERKIHVREDLSGTCDLYDTWTNTVIDYKFPGTTAMTEYRKSGPSRTYRVQAHLYGAGYLNDGYPVERVGIWFLPRGGIMANSLLWIEDYSQAIVDETLKHIDDVMILAQELDVETHPERWQWFPRTAHSCSYCPYLLISKSDEPQACPGAGPVERTNATTA